MGISNLVLRGMYEVLELSERETFALFQLSPVVQFASLDAVLSVKF